MKLEKFLFSLMKLPSNMEALGWSMGGLKRLAFSLGRFSLFDGE